MSLPEQLYAFCLNQLKLVCVALQPRTLACTISGFKWISRQMWRTALDSQGYLLVWASTIRDSSAHLISKTAQLFPPNTHLLTFTRRQALCTEPVLSSRLIHSKTMRSALLLLPFTNGKTRFSRDWIMCQSHIIILKIWNQSMAHWSPYSHPLQPSNPPVSLSPRNAIFYDHADQQHVSDPGQTSQFDPM